MLKSSSWALTEWCRYLGKEHVITDFLFLNSFAVFHDSRPCSITAILNPSSREQIQACVKIAKKAGLAICPMSSGKNWGLNYFASRHDVVIIDLSRLNRIIEYDDQLGYITVEPGVTQKQLSDFLRKERAKFFYGCTGSSGATSLIGNILQRGDAAGLQSNRFNYVCDFEVVMSDGEIFYPGLRRFGNQKLNRLQQDNLGPTLEGLFVQSDFGIVTEMTLWLTPLPDYFQILTLNIQDKVQLGKVVEITRDLKLNGLLPASFGLWNSYKMLAVNQQYPWEAMQGETPLSREWLSRWCHDHDISAWKGGTGFYFSDEKLARVQSNFLINKFKKAVKDIYFIDFTRNEIEYFLWNSPLKDPPNIAKQLILQNNGPMLGVPTEKNLFSAYWRKKKSPSQHMDIIADQCGLYWGCVQMPLTGEDVFFAAQISEDIIFQHGFEPNLAILIQSDRVAVLAILIVYDQEIAGENNRALACHNELLQALIAKGYFPSRLNAQSMQVLPPAAEATQGWLDSIRGIF